MTFPCCPAAPLSMHAKGGGVAVLCTCASAAGPFTKQQKMVFNRGSRSSKLAMFEVIRPAWTKATEHRGAVIRKDIGRG